MAGELAHPGRGRDQDGAVRAALASLRRATHWHDSTGMPGPHAVLDGRRSGDEAPRGEYPFVSLAVALSWAVSDADRGVTRGQRRPWHVRPRERRQPIERQRGVRP